MLHRGTSDRMTDVRHILRDDNTSPTLAFLWASGRTKGPDVQHNHVWNDSANPDAYTALWNICATPAFLAKTTDGSNHPDVVAALRYRAWDLYRCRAAGHAEPTKPAGYDELVWAPHPPPVAALGNHPSRPTPNESEEPPRTRRSDDRLALQRLATRPDGLTTDPARQPPRRRTRRPHPGQTVARNTGGP
jgi:hypothetical protein